MQPPLEVWQTIAGYIPPNPITYTSLSHICQGSRSVFFSDNLWRPFNPTKSQKGFAQLFFARAGALDPSQKELLLGLWKDVRTFDYWNSDKDYSEIQINDNLDLAIPYCLLVGAKLFKQRDDFGDFDDFSDFEDDSEDEDSSASGSEAAAQSTSPNSNAPTNLQLPLGLFSQREFVLCVVSLWGPLLAHAPDFQQDNEVVLAAVSTRHSLGWKAPETDGHALRFAPVLQGNETIVTEAIKADGLCFEFASQELQKDPAFVERIASINGTVLSFASSAIRGNKKILTAAILNSGLGLAYASHELKGDRELVLAAVRIRGASLRDALPRLKIDKEVIDAAVANDPSAEKYIPEDIDEIKEMLGVAYLPPKEPRPLI